MRGLTTRLTSLLVLSLAAAACASSPPSRARNIDPSAVLANADANGDGRITKMEFVDGRGRMFDRIDRNGDGYISRDDAPRIRRRGSAGGGGGGGRGGRMAELAAGLDANGDGRVSSGEFVDGPSFIFDQADTNGDDVIDTTELQTFKPAIAARQANR